MGCMDRQPLRSIQYKRNTGSKVMHTPHPPPLLHTQWSKGRKKVAALTGSPGHSREVCCLTNRSKLDSVSPESMRQAGENGAGLEGYI